MGIRLNKDLMSEITATIEDAAAIYKNYNAEDQRLMIINEVCTSNYASFMTPYVYRNMEDQSTEEWQKKYNELREDINKTADAVLNPLSDLLKDPVLKKRFTSLATSTSIPLSTCQSWMSGKRECPFHVKMMILDEIGYFDYVEWMPDEYYECNNMEEDSLFLRHTYDKSELAYGYVFLPKTLTEESLAKVKDIIIWPETESAIDNNKEHKENFIAQKVLFSRDDFKNTNLGYFNICTNTKGKTEYIVTKEPLLNELETICNDVPYDIKLYIRGPKIRCAVSKDLNHYEPYNIKQRIGSKK